MDKKWKIKSSEVLLKTPHFDVKLDKCEDFAGKDRDYYKMEGPSSGYVMIVPIKVKDGVITYVMVEQYRHGCGQVSLEFPAGSREPGEASIDAAERELLEETGYEASQIKFMYTEYLNPVRSSDKQSIFLANLPDKPGQTAHEQSEIGSGMKVVELTADELHRKILDNEIISTSTLSALCAVMLSSKQAIKYLEMDG